MKTTFSPRSAPYFPFLDALFLALAVIGMGVDLLLAKAAFDVIINDSEFASALVAGGMVIVAGLVSVAFGSAFLRGRRTLALTMLAVWLGIGIALAGVRWNRGSLEGLENEPADRWIAMLMFAIFVAAGVEIALHGGKLFSNDRYFAVRSARRAVGKVDRKRNKVAAEYGRIGVALGRLPEIRERAGRQHDMAQDRIDSAERQLHAYARDLIIEALAGARNGGLINQPVTIDDYQVRADEDINPNG